jgi:hypothetical protein
MAIADRIRSFLDKNTTEKIGAVRATMGLGPSNALFRRRLSGQMGTVTHSLLALAVIERGRYVKELFADPAYGDNRRLPQFGFKVYSQTDEDGIIQEIFARIGYGSKTFVEFGVGNGLENNTVKLLLEGWRGLWMEGSSSLVSQIEVKFREVVRQGHLQLRHAFINRDNINQLIGETFKSEIDLISIDIDGNDIYLLEALQVVNPRVIVIEYNAKFPPPMSIAQTYDATFRWRGTDYYGASLEAITKIAERKGYSLVGCGIAGVNAFFVRNDLLADKFCPPYTSTNHYQPARYFLVPTYIAGHEPDWGSYVTI